MNESELSNWFVTNKLDPNSGKVVVRQISWFCGLVYHEVSIAKDLNYTLFQVKPTRAGSSIGVTVAYGVIDSLKKAKGIMLEVLQFLPTLNSDA